MKPSDQIRQFIMNKEGFRDTAYKPLPTDRYTIGFGATFYLDGSPVCEGDTISREDAEKLFNTNLDTFAAKLSTKTNPNCTQQQFDAVLSLCYNIGLGAFLNSQSGTMYYNGQNISSRFVLWNKSGGKVIDGLTTRRLQEKDIYDKGIYK